MSFAVNGNCEIYEETYKLNCMKTRFQISSTSGSSMLTRWLASRPPMRSKWISEHGPQGPTSPICQKLSFIPKGITLSGGSLQNNRGLECKQCLFVKRLLAERANRRPFFVVFCCPSEDVTCGYISAHPKLSQISLASLSGSSFRSSLPPKYVTYNLSFGMCSRSTSNSHAHSIASFCGYSEHFGRLSLELEPIHQETRRPRPESARFHAIGIVNSLFVSHGQPFSLTSLADKKLADDLWWGSFFWLTWPNQLPQVDFVSKGGGIDQQAGQLAPPPTTKLFCSGFVLDNFAEKMCPHRQTRRWWLH